ncbi:hypothetical protein PanWU01x14_152850, partial [Parasponia andersonii]
MSCLRYSKVLTAPAQDIYKNWKNELSKYFKLNGRDENSLDLSRARYSIPSD